MMKKNLNLLAVVKYSIRVVLLTVCLVGFAFARVAPTSTVHAASDTRLLLSSAGPSEREAVPLTRSALPVVFVGTGLVCALFGIIAVSPLLVDGSSAVISRSRSSREGKLDLETAGDPLESA